MDKKRYNSNMWIVYKFASVYNNTSNSIIKI